MAEPESVADIRSADAGQPSQRPLRLAREWAGAWLFDHALPLWWRQGADQVEGGFHEKLDAHARPAGTPTRLRVQARQIYVYAQAGYLGWSGPWRDAVAHGLDFMLTRHARPDGLFRSAVDDLDNGPVDLYDQAFALFALAHAYPIQGQPAAILRRARDLMRALDDTLSHPLGGFEEARPRVLPLRSNPHMHLLEALLAWVEIGVEDPFRLKAGQLIELARSRMIDPRTGAVGEYFDGDWKFASGAAGAVREPGHQFEWAYLLELSQRLLACDLSAERDRLLDFGTAYGLDTARNVAVFSVDDSGHVLNANARLWAQTEWLRACLVVSERAPMDRKTALQQSAADAFESVRNFLGCPRYGLWHEWMNADGSFRPEASPASSLYHVMSAFRELLRIEF